MQNDTNEPQPQRWRIAVKDPEWRWGIGPDGKPWGTKSLTSQISPFKTFDKAEELRFIHVSDDGNFYLPSEDRPRENCGEPFVCDECRKLNKLWYAPCPHTPLPASRVDIERLQALYDASTPGEWEYESAEPRNRESCYAELITPCGTIADTANSSLILIEEESDEGAMWYWDENGRKNFEFIAAAHNAMRQLLAEVRELRERVVQLTSQCTDLEAWQLAAGDKTQHLAASQSREQRLREMLKTSCPWVNLRERWTDADIDAELGKG